MKITAQTKVVALFGYPVTHTLSPLFQNAAFRAAGVDAVYLVFEIPPLLLKDAIKAVKDLNFLGANLTIPHKETALLFLDEVSETASRIGSVNTLVNHSGILKGETTDGPGFLLSLKEKGINPKLKKVLLVGAGGAARAVAFALVKAGASVTITNRTAERGEKLVSDLKRYYPQTEAEFVPFSEKTTFLKRKDYDILINATSVGLKKGETLFRSSDLPEKIVVCDLIYHRKTELLAAAEKRGLTTISGLGMLVYQGALSFRLWTGKPAPLKIMFSALKNQLRSKAYLL